MNNSPNKARRMVLILSGGVDALLGAFLLLIGFGFLPIDVNQFGLENWHVILLGGALFIMGMIFVAYNLSRLEE